MRIKHLFVASLFLLSTIGLAGAGETPAETTHVGLPLTGQEAVDFLTTAEVTSKPEDFDDLAITSPRRMELSDGTRTLRAIFKDENTLHRGTFRYGDGREVPMVKDSYLHEIAAYDLAVTLGFDFVPPCVERKLFNRKGSLCLWVEDSMTEAERKEEGLEPPNPRLWNKRMFAVRLFQQLISDQDFSNIRNILVDSDFRRSTRSIPPWPSTPRTRSSTSSSLPCIRAASSTALDALDHAGSKRCSHPGSSRRRSRVSGTAAIASSNGLRNRRARRGQGPVLTRYS